MTARWYMASTSSTHNTNSAQTAPTRRAARVELQVEVAATDPEARKRRLMSPVEQMESERPVEDHRRSHVLSQ